MHGKETPMNNGDFDYYNKTYEQEGDHQTRRDPQEDISGVVDSLSQPRTMLYSILSLVCGLASLVLGCCGGWFGLGIGALAIAFSIIARHHLGYFDTKAVIGLVLGIAGAVFGVAVIVLDGLIASGALDAYLEDLLKDIDPDAGSLPPPSGTV